MTRWAQSAVIASLLVLAAPASAQQPKQDDVATAEAKQRFGEGIKLADAGNHEAARLKFNQAWVLMKSPAIVFNLARSEQLSNHPVEALEHYRAFLKMGSDPKVTEAQKQRAAENIAALTTKVGQIDVEAPAGARISIDTRAVEWTPSAEPFPVMPGSHVVEAVIDGKTRSVTVDCAPGTVTKAKLVEDPATPPQAAPPPPPVAPTQTETSRSFWTTGRAVGAGLGVGGLLAVGAGVFFQLRAGTANDEAAALRRRLGTTGCDPTLPAVPPECSDLRSRNDEKASSETLRTVFLISGGALVAGGVVLFLLSPPQASTSALRVVPYASERDAGVQFFGRF